MTVKSSIFQIKRSSTVATPAKLMAGELAYSFNSDKMFIGGADEVPVQIGGKYLVDWHTANKDFIAAAEVAAEIHKTEDVVDGIKLHSAKTWVDDKTLAAYVDSRIAESSVNIDEGTGIVIEGAGTEVDPKIISLDVSGVTAGAYGSATKVAKVTVDAYGRVTAAEEVDVAAITLAKGEAKVAAKPSESIELSVDETAGHQGAEVTVSAEGVKFGIDQSVIATRTYVDDSISALGDVYNVKGSVATYAELAAKEADAAYGDVYNVIEQCTHDGKVFPAGTNFVWVRAESEEGTAHWDPLGGTVDLSSFINEVKTTADGNTVVGLTKDGQAVSGALANRLTTVTQATAAVAANNFVSGVVLDQAEGKFEVKVTNAELTTTAIKDVTASATEVNALVGVESNVQEQFDAITDEIGTDTTVDSIKYRIKTLEDFDVIDGGTF